jgi:hypothetical protein
LCATIEIITLQGQFLRGQENENVKRKKIGDFGFVIGGACGVFANGEGGGEFGAECTAGACYEEFG